LKTFYYTNKPSKPLMSGKQFFINRYKQLGWQYKPVKLKQAIRINQTNTQGKNVIDRLEKNGVQLEKISFLPYGYWVTNFKVSPGATAEYLLGHYSMQEAAAQVPVTQFSNLENKQVLDVAAAPGGKTVQMADYMQNTGAIIAIDINKRRLTALTNHLERCHVTNTVVYQLDARNAPKMGYKFDRILVDAPCSGNFASDPNWFKNRTLQDIERNARVQREILAKATDCLNQNGEIVYSTCSLEPEEDELNIDWAIKKLNLEIKALDCTGQKGLTEVFGKQLDPSIELCRRFWPDETQGFFICKLGRSNK
jgi:NOL1/NOP2/sun family putative RNA methylase